MALPPGIRWRAAPATPAATSPGTVVYAVGDIHGRIDLLDQLIEGILADSRERGAVRRALTFLGDYVNRGPACRAVVERLLALRPDGFETRFLMGNVEQAMLRYLDGEMAIAINWIEYGGIETAAAYGVGTPPRRWDEKSLDAMRWMDGYQDAYGATMPPEAAELPALEKTRADLLAAMPPEHLSFFRNLEVKWRDGDYCFVHAGIAPGRPIEEQHDRDCLWIRRRFLDSELDHGAIIVHGHSIAPEPQIRPNRIGIDTGAYKSGILTCLVLDGRTRGFLQTGE